MTWKDIIKVAEDERPPISRYNRYNARVYSKLGYGKKGKKATSEYKRCDMCSKNISLRNVNESRSGLSLCNHCKKVKKADVPEGTTHIMISEHYENADGNKEWAVYFADDDGFEIETIDGFYSKEHAYDYALELGKKLKLEVDEE